MKRRFYPAFVTLLGGVGLGLALTYFVGVILVFLPGMEDWALFFMDWALLLLVPPYVLLVAHMVLRNHVGRYLLKERAYEEALAYGKRRSKKSLLRSKREASNQTLVWAQALVGLGRYEEAEELLVSRGGRLSGEYSVEAFRWRLEIALRFNDLDGAEAIIDGCAGSERKKKGKGRRFSALKAAEGELALRKGDEERYRDCMMDALWASPGHQRAQLSRALAMVEFGYYDEDAFLSVEAVQDFASQEIPARAGELQALLAMMKQQSGAVEEGLELLRRARQEPSDRWSDQVIERVEAKLKP